LCILKSLYFTKKSASLKELKKQIFFDGKKKAGWDKNPKPAFFLSI